MSEKKFRLSFETVLQYKIMDNDTNLNESEVVDLLNKLYEENEQLKKSEKINMEYAEQIVEENQKLRIAKNDLRIENEQLHLAIDDLLSHTSCDEIKKENEQLRKQVKSSETTSDATSNYNAHLESKITTLEKENEQLRKQIQNYEQLIANSYVGKEETLDGFVGKYVIWEDELQKYKKR